MNVINFFNKFSKNWYKTGKWVMLMRLKIKNCFSKISNQLLIACCLKLLMA